MFNQVKQSTKQSFYGLTPKEYVDKLDLNESSLNLDHIKKAYQFIYKDHNQNFEGLENIIPKKIIYQMKERLDLNLPQIVEHKVSKDGTHKLLIELFDKQRVETVLIPFRKKYTICLSTQVGCAMGCRFCHTATMGFTRNLSTDEIVSQYLLGFKILRSRNKSSKTNPTPTPNIVFMGQGEPLHNYENVRKACEIFMVKQGLYLGPRQITLSTVGHLAGLKKINSFPPINFAFSLHSPFEKQRQEIIPSASGSTLNDIFSIFDRHNLLKKQFITYEYLILKDVNHSKEHAQELVNLLKNRKALINLIPFNPYPQSNYQRPKEDEVEEFKNELVSKGLRVMVRTTKGDEILAACGQLKSLNNQNLNRERSYETTPS